jgi:CRISPR-associated protein Cmr6
VRKELEGFPAKDAENSGLVFERWLKGAGEKHAQQKELLQAVAGHGVPAPYHDAYHRWKEMLGLVPDMLIRDYEATTPIACGLGNETVHENGLSLNRLYGVPFIPGSSLKGVMKRAAAEMLSLSGRVEDHWFKPQEDEATILAKAPSELHDGLVQLLAMFGSQDRMGALSVFDAWMSPSTGKPFRVDTVTVHHQGYYQGKQNLPLDSDEPNPVAFLSVRAGCRFTCVVQLPNESWQDPITQLLDHALTCVGIGSKTNSGYGFMKPVVVRDSWAPSSGIDAVVVRKVSAEQKVEVKFSDGSTLRCQVPSRGLFSSIRDGDTVRVSAPTGRSVVLEKVT